MEDRVESICQLLLGAAYADDEFHDREMETILELLAKLMKVDEVPADLAAKLNEFDKDAFDLQDCAKEFADESEEHKLELLELVAAVHEADDEYSFDEDDFIRELGLALDLEAAHIAKMAIEFEVEDLQASFEKLKKKPTPPPTPPQ
jgi:uncharacterized tellurite resistance protein B-like protein